MNQEKKTFPQIEEDVLKLWQDRGIFKKTLAKESPKGTFVFYEGPPTANGRPGIHHLLARAFKDIVLRYKTMQGFNVPRKAGWDTHGLPVELQVEKELGISGKPDIEKYGVKEFNAKCKESVWVYKEEWEKLTARMGYWLDMENPYVTYSNEYIESVWSAIKQVGDNGLVYLGHKVVPHCPRCGTALSSHEVAQGYKEVTEPTIYVAFKLKQDPKTSIVSWTTTPWTLPGNVALAVGKEIEYSKVKIDDNFYIAASQLLDQVFAGKQFEVVEKMTGADLAGLEYEPLFPGAIDAGDKKAWYVATAEFVTTSDGSGVVHIAPMYGIDDYELGEKLDLPKVHTVDENGKFKDTVTKWAGKFVKNKTVGEEISADLNERGQLVNSKPYTHDYPFCWRCDTPLLYYAKDSWFIKMSSLVKKLVSENEKINWVPDNIKEGRFGEWIAGAKDWAISRERYWGTPLPIWTCGSSDCEGREIIGSYAELAERSGRELGADFDPHRPFIDEYSWPCQTCKQGTMTRVKAVIDCWLDSGAMPLAQLHYPFENKELIDEKKFYPADFICEAIDQTRGWFYTLLALSTAMGNERPYKNVICLGHLNDKLGKKMSKSKGNVVDPWEMMNKYGVDALRLHLYTINQPGEPKNFDEQALNDVVRRTFVVLWNVLNFYQMYSEKLDDTIEAEENILDKWIMAKLNVLTKEMTIHLDEYDIFKTEREFESFVTELSTWFVRRSRDRFKDDENPADQQSAIRTLGKVLNVLSKLMAPGTPFMAEELYFQTGGKMESVHLEDWPTTDEKIIDFELLTGMESVRAVIENLLAIRSAEGIKVRQVLSKAVITDKTLPAEFYQIIQDEVNVKEVVLGSEMALDLVLTDELKLEGHFRDLTRQINNLRKEMGLTPADLVELYLATDDEDLNKMIDVFGDELKKAVKAKEILREKIDLPESKEVKINDRLIRIGIGRNV